MGLFDSLLNNNSQTPAAQNPAPEVTPDATPIITTPEVGASSPINPETELGNITLHPTQATNDALSLMTGGPIEVTSSDTPNDTSSVLVSDTSVSPTPEVTTPVMEMSAEMPAMTDTTGPLVVDSHEEIAPMEEAISAPLMAEVPTAEAVHTEVAETEAQAETRSLFGAETEAETTSSLFGNTSESQEETSPIALEETPKTEPMTSGVPASTQDFIAESQQKLDDMLKNILSQKEAFLEEADRHKAEKEAYAQREVEAKEKANALNGEIAHIKSMQAYLDKQSKQANEVAGSVNTSLTGISVQHNVEGAITKKPRKTTAKKAVDA